MIGDWSWGKCHCRAFRSVVTNPSENDYLGAEVGSNNTAELTAIGHAARWILSQPGEGVVVIREIHNTRSISHRGRGELRPTRLGRIGQDPLDGGGFCTRSEGRTCARSSRTPVERKSRSSCFQSHAGRVSSAVAILEAWSALTIPSLKAHLR